MSKDLNPDTGLHPVGPDLGPNCKDYQQTTKVTASKERVKIENVPFDSVLLLSCWVTVQAAPHESVLKMGLLKTWVKD